MVRSPSATRRRCAAIVRFGSEADIGDPPKSGHWPTRQTDQPSVADGKAAIAQRRVGSGVVVDCVLPLADFAPDPDDLIDLGNQQLAWSAQVDHWGARCVGGVFVALVLGFTAPPPGWAQTNDDPWAQCIVADPDARIAGCSALIGSGQLSGVGLSDAYNDRALGYRQKALYDLAIADFNQAISLDPGDATSIHNRGLTFELMGLHDSAIADFTQEIALKPDDAQGYNSRAQTNHLAGRDALGLPDAERAVSLAPGNADVFVTRGEIYEKLGRRDDAISDYRAALRLDPNVQGAKFFLTGLGATFTEPSAQSMAQATQPMTVQQAAQAFGLIGSWATDCGQVASLQNMLDIYSLESDGTISSVTNAGPGEDSGRYSYSQALLVDSDRLQIDGVFSGNKHAPGSAMHIVIQKNSAGQMRVFSSVDGSGKILVQNGTFTSDPSDGPPWENKCS
jgi:tetratricopeptide (TPR) repeat protein